jgi:hypothetical protein
VFDRTVVLATSGCVVISVYLQVYRYTKNSKHSAILCEHAWWSGAMSRY